MSLISYNETHILFLWDFLISSEIVKAVIFRIQ